MLHGHMSPVSASLQKKAGNTVQHKRYLIAWSAVLLLSAGTANAHVQIDYPAGGEMFAPGETVQIAWHIIIHHEQEDWDLYYSTDGGETWQVIEENVSKDMLTYDWTVPDIPTEMARVRVVQDNVEVDYDDYCPDFTILDQPVGVAGEGPAPQPVILYPNTPNPFNPSTAITYELSAPGGITLKIFSITGQTIRTLTDGPQPAGLHRITWDGRDDSGQRVVSGVYIIRLSAGSFSRSRKMLLLR